MNMYKFKYTHMYLKWFSMNTFKMEFIPFI